jgi:hypothetical protein
MISRVAAKLEGRGAAVMFERIKDHTAPVFTGRHDRSRFFLCT